MEQQNSYHRPLKDVSLGIYELINHTTMEAAQGIKIEPDEVGEITGGEVSTNIDPDANSYINTQMMLQTQMNFGFGPQRLDLESVGDYGVDRNIVGRISENNNQTADSMNKT